MKTISLVALLALAGCLQLPKLPTPAEICAMPPAVQQTLLDALGSSVEGMILACTVVK